MTDAKTSLTAVATCCTCNKVFTYELASATDVTKRCCYKRLDHVACDDCLAKWPKCHKNRCSRKFCGCVFTYDASRPVDPDAYEPFDSVYCPLHAMNPRVCFTCDEYLCDGEELIVCFVCKRKAHKQCSETCSVCHRARCLHCNVECSLSLVCGSGGACAYCLAHDRVSLCEGPEHKKQEPKS